jgi:hypothetical protein
MRRRLFAFRSGLGWPKLFSNWRRLGSRRESLDLEWSADVRFGAHNGLESDIAPCLKGAMKRLMRCRNSFAIRSPRRQ